MPSRSLRAPAPPPAAASATPAPTAPGTSRAAPTPASSGGGRRGAQRPSQFCWRQQPRSWQWGRPLSRATPKPSRGPSAARLGRARDRAGLGPGWGCGGSGSSSPCPGQGWGRGARAQLRAPTLPAPQATRPIGRGRAGARRGRGHGPSASQTKRGAGRVTKAPRGGRGGGACRLGVDRIPRCSCWLAEGKANGEASSWALWAGPRIPLLRERVVYVWRSVCSRRVVALQLRASPLGCARGSPQAGGIGARCPVTQDPPAVPLSLAPFVGTPRKAVGPLPWGNWDVRRLHLGTGVPSPPHPGPSLDLSLLLGILLFAGAGGGAPWCGLIHLCGEFPLTAKQDN